MFSPTREDFSLDSREVAEMVGKQHKNLLSDIRGYVNYMEESGKLNFQPSDFFNPSTYLNEQNRSMPCFLITRKGCEFIANKLTGKKGVLFTATYINRFHEMESNIPLSMPPETLARLLASTATYTNAQARIMIHEGHSWHDVGRMFKATAKATGLPYSPLLGTHPNHEQLLLEQWNCDVD